MTTDPETLELYASIFEKPRRVEVKRPTGTEWHLTPAGEPCVAAARALRFLAAHITSESK